MNWLLLPIILCNLFFFPPKGLTIENLDSTKVEVESVEMRETITRFIDTLVFTEDYKILLHRSEDDLADAGSEDAIYFIVDDSNKPLLVVKTLPLDDPEFRDEYYAEKEALQYFKKVPLRHAHVVRPHAFAEFVVDGEKRGFIAEEVAKGKSINAMLKDFSNEKENLEKAVVKLAKAMAEIHKVKNFAKPNRLYYDRYDDIQDLTERDVTLEYPGPYGIIHGDMHPGNIFYHEQSGKIHLIDLSYAKPSFKGAPVALDPGRFLCSFEFLAAYQGVPTKEIQHIQTLFRESYVKANPHVTMETLATYEELSDQEFNIAFSDPNLKHLQGRFVYSYTNKKMGAWATLHESQTDLTA